MKKWKKKHIFDSGFWDQEIATHKKAMEFIATWNAEKFVDKTYVTCLPRKEICIKSSSHIGGTGVVLNEWTVVEDYIEGEWEKWNSNSGLYLAAVSDRLNIDCLKNTVISVLLFLQDMCIAATHRCRHFVIGRIITAMDPY